MKRKSNPSGLVTLLLIIAAIVILHALRDFRERADPKHSDAALTEGLIRY